MTDFRQRDGYSLVEVIVALMLFTVGALALMSTSTVLAIQLGNDARRERAGRIAAERIEVVRSTCHAAATGTERVGDVTSSWAVTPGVRNDLLVVETASYLTSRGSRIDSLRALVPCR
ncbi:MAG TPA: prepilin-type N-terminal cleavage/methylation domain-containing protein [Gemmatimonadaceae bacterium]|nr:prepilin-type N-terminal cleavage/methylation domain-containing protein [Gemmatimonadaceae bacterium]